MNSSEKDVLGRDKVEAICLTTTTLNPQEQQIFPCPEDENCKTSSPCIKDFDDVLDIVGSVGKFQRFILYGILFPLSVFESIFALNLWFLMDEPNHWCHVPGRNDTDMDTWKNLTIPRKENGEFSKCTMYNTSTGSIIDNSTTLSIVDCTSGWDYDFSVADYRSILTDYNWVCDKSHWSTWVHTATNAGRALGTFILGFLADRIGRKPVFIITIMLFSFGRATGLFFVGDIRLFVTMALIAGMSAPMFAISNNTIAIELSGKEFRAWIYSFTWMTVVIGMAVVPIIALLTPNWLVLGWTTILIGSISYLFLPWLPESPRWLLSVGRVEEVVTILRRIGRWNGTDHKIQEQDLRKMLQDIVSKGQDAGENKDEQSILKLFSKRRVAKHTFLITFSWVMNALVFHGLNLNSLNLHGHRYLNFFLVILMEVPGSLWGGMLCDKFGRRWVKVGCFLVTGASCTVAAFSSLFVGGDGTTVYTVLVIVAANIAKIAATMSFLATYLQAAELFPTPLRTTGSGMASTISSITVILVPFIVYTGKSSRITPWVASAIMSFIGMISATFIPETLNYNLPETLEEADNFGKGRKFWSFRLPKERKQ